MINVECKICNKIFQVKPWYITNGRGKFCSKECYYINLRGNKRPNTMNGIYRNCFICNKEFYVPMCFVEKGIKLCCSRKCGYKMRILPKRNGKDAPAWKGGIIKTQRGYLIIYNPSHPFCNPRGYVRQHRLIMEENIKRYLNSKEVVHHINGIKTDNRIENLKLFKNNSEHMKYHNPKGSMIGANA